MPTFRRPPAVRASLFVLLLCLLTVLTLLPALTPPSHAAPLQQSSVCAGLDDIAGMVAHDADGSGQADRGEGLAGVPVTLYRQNPDATWTQIDATTTDAEGCYRLAYGLLEPTVAYRVQVAASHATLAGLVPAFDPDGSDSPHVFTFTPPATATDFGYQLAPACAGTDLTGYVVQDSNANGQADAGEGLAGVTVQLHRLTGGSWSQIDSTTTDAQGCYRLLWGLIKGDAWRVAVVPDGALASLTPAFDPDGTSTPHQFTFTPPATATDFGYAARATTCQGADIAGMVAHDTDADGSAELGEGLAGVSVALYGPDGAGGERTLQTSITDEEGCYHFSFGPAELAWYRVTVNPSAPALASLVPSFDPDGTQTPHSYQFTEPPLATDLGYRAAHPTCLGSDLAGLVVQDANGNQAADAGEGLASVPVRLLKLVGETYQVQATTVTDAAGCYHFDYPAPRALLLSYRVELDPAATALTGLLPAFDPDGVASPHQFTFTPYPTATDFGYRAAPTALALDAFEVRPATWPWLALLGPAVVLSLLGLWLHHSRSSSSRSQAL